MTTLLALLSVWALRVAAADISGTWKLDGNIANVHVDRICTITQVANKLTGHCKNPTSDVALTGEVDGSSVTWTYVADYEGQKLTLVYKGILESETAMKGTISTSGVSGDFTAKKQ
jgi:hypothetical protein